MPRTADREPVGLRVGSGGKDGNRPSGQWVRVRQEGVCCAGALQHVQAQGRAGLEATRPAEGRLGSQSRTEAWPPAKVGRQERGGGRSGLARAA